MRAAPQIVIEFYAKTFRAFFLSRVVKSQKHLGELSHKSPQKQRNQNRIRNREDENLNLFQVNLQCNLPSIFMFLFCNFLVNLK